MTNKLKFCFYLGSYSLLLSVIFAVFIILRLFSYVNNDKSNLICLNDKSKNETASNMIFLLDEQPDKLNDIKARKFCQYRIIRDYNNTYQTPPNVNYTLLPAVTTESSWLNDIFICAVLFLAGSVIIETGWRIIFKVQTTVWSRLRDLLLYLIE